MNKSLEYLHVQYENEISNQMFVTDMRIKFLIISHFSKPP